MKPIVATVEWYGPYTLETARLAASDYGDGIYLTTARIALEIPNAQEQQLLGQSPW